ncbi:alpha/beta fold hydrolase [Jhaorihella thermophila]
MVVVGGAVPIIRRRDLNSMAAYQRSAAYTARYAPALLPMVLRLGMAQIDSRDFDDLVHGIFPPGSHDHDVIRRLDLVGWIRSGYCFSVQQSYLGFLGDAHFAVRDWRSLIPQPAAPVILLHGARDPVITPEMARAFAEGRDNVDLRLIKNAGQLIVYEHPDLVLDALDELTGRAAASN